MIGTGRVFRSFACCVSAALLASAVSGCAAGVAAVVYALVDDSGGSSGKKDQPPVVTGVSVDNTQNRDEISITFTISNEDRGTLAPRSSS